MKEKTPGGEGGGGSEREDAWLKRKREGGGGIWCWKGTGKENSIGEGKSGVRGESTRADQKPAFSQEKLLVLVACGGDGGFRSDWKRIREQLEMGWANGGGGGGGGTGLGIGRGEEVFEEVIGGFG